jgi:hypothetical protein
MLKILITTSIIIAVLTAGVPGCPHPIFCDEAILTAVANSNYYPDSKSFVDTILTVPIEQALKNFNSQTIQQFLNSSVTSNNTIL